MASQVDNTFPVDNIKPSKGDFRAILTVIKNEITALQAKIALPGTLAFSDSVSRDEITRLIKLSKSNIARDIAYARVSL